MRVSGIGGNYFTNNLWLTRDNSGLGGWLSARSHDGISIDGSFLTPGSDTRTWWERAPFQDIQLWGNANQTYMVLKQGNLGIGTTTPGSYKLAVAGKIAANEEVRVFAAGTTAFPDYVFDPTYVLPNLEETEKYVKENRHLPEVPSAMEIESEGMSLNGMSVILLKKVEELTLYMIEMKKKTTALQNENDELKTRINKLEKK